MTESITERLEKLEKEHEELEPKKEFKLPWAIRFTQGKLKKESVIVVFIRTNGSIVFKILPITEETIMFNNKIYDARAGNMMRYKNKPAIIIKEWDMLPLNNKDEVEKASEKGTLTAAQKLILTKMKQEQIKATMQWSWGTIGILAAVLIGGYALMSYMGYM